jgi:hypothetical protein
VLEVALLGHPDHKVHIIKMGDDFADLAKPWMIPPHFRVVEPARCPEPMIRYGPPPLPIVDYYFWKVVAGRIVYKRPGHVVGSL